MRKESGEGGKDQIQSRIRETVTKMPERKKQEKEMEEDVTHAVRMFATLSFNRTVFLFGF